jgi:hypothetical protein
MRRTVFGVWLLLVAACGGPATATAPPTATPKPLPTESVVEWQDYAPDVQSQLDTLAEAKDCDALQQQFDIAVSTSHSTLNRTGHSNAKLIAYIDAAMRDAGCYF